MRTGRRSGWLDGDIVQMDHHAPGGAGENAEVAVIEDGPSPARSSPSWPWATTADNAARRQSEGLRQPGAARTVLTSGQLRHFVACERGRFFSRSCEKSIALAPAPKRSRRPRRPGPSSPGSTRSSRSVGEVGHAEWIKNTYITDDTERNAATANEEVMAYTAGAIKQSVRFHGLKLDPDTERMFAGRQALGSSTIARISSTRDLQAVADDSCREATRVRRCGGSLAASARDRSAAS